MPPAGSADPFGTAGLRQAVLAAWAASPARFREDANAEEALATGGYADRLLIELAANALDAAREAGVPGRVRFSLDTSAAVPQLRAANVGVRLTAAGVAGLASLRASAKRGRAATVGHFGVGFTAVLAVSDGPEVVSGSGGVRFSRVGTAAAISALGHDGLEAEMAARGGHVPVLRLPWPMDPVVLQDDPVPAGFDTQVRLPLRHGLAPAVAEVLDAVGDGLLWALPGLQTVEVELPGRPLRIMTREDLDDGVTVIDRDGVPARYRVADGRGLIPADLLGDRPIEERERNQWQLTWVWPEPGEQRDTSFAFQIEAPTEPVFLGAPTPTDEPLSLRARLIGTFPVDDTRRRLAVGPLTDYLLAQAAIHYVDLFSLVPLEHRFSLVPSAGFPLGPIDAVLRAGIVAKLSRAPVAVTALNEPVAPAEASVVSAISDAAAVLLGRAVPGLLLPPHSPGQMDALRMLGVTVVPLADATTALAGIDGPPGFWREVYQALADQPGEDLANLPVPLSGGGRRIGPAGCLLPGPESADVDLLTRAALLAPDLRIVHPDAAHPLLGRLGAVPADATALVTDPALIQLFRDFRADLEDSDPDPDELRDLARLALDLTSATGSAVLEDVVLTDADDQAWPAAELLAPGAPLASVLADDADLPMVGQEWTRYPQHALTRIGVRTGLKVVPVENADADLPDLGQWWSEVVGDAMPPETFYAIADLDLIDDDKWPELLRMIVVDRDALHTLTSGPDPSYTRWWLSNFALIAGRSPNYWRLPGAVDLAGLYDELPVPIDTGIAVAIGVLSQGADVVRSDPSELIRRLADPDLRITAGAVPRLTRLAADALEQHPGIALPELVRTLSGAVVDAEDALVLDLPWFAQVADVGTVVAGGADPLRVSRLFDLDLVSEGGEVTVVGADPVELTPTQRQAAERAAAWLGLDLAALFPARTLLVAADLSVQLKTVDVQRVWWWAGADVPTTGDLALVCDGSADGIGRAVAWKAGRWSDRAAAVVAAQGGPIALAEDGLT